MIALTRQRHKYFDAVLVWKLSRFARSREGSIIYKSLLLKNKELRVQMDGPEQKRLGLTERLKET